MKYLVMLLLVFSPLAGASSAALVFQSQQMRVHLLPTACTNPKILEVIKADKRTEYRAANVTWEGKVIPACWRPFDQENILIIDETMDYGFMPISAFRSEEGV